MKLVAQYRRCAADIEWVAAKATPVAYRDELLAIARAWHHLADDREKMLEALGTIPPV